MMGNVVVCSFFLRLKCFLVYQYERPSVIYEDGFLTDVVDFVVLSMIAEEIIVILSITILLFY